MHNQRQVNMTGAIGSKNTIKSLPSSSASSSKGSAAASTLAKSVSAMPLRDVKSSLFSSGTELHTLKASSSRESVMTASKSGCLSKSLLTELKQEISKHKKSSLRTAGYFTEIITAPSSSSDRVVSSDKENNKQSSKGTSLTSSFLSPVKQTSSSSLGSDEMENSIILDTPLQMQNSRMRKLSTESSPF